MSDFLSTITCDRLVSFELSFTFVFMNPCIAIIDNNTLSAIALQGILWDIFPGAEVLAFCDMDSFLKDSDRHYVHFFVNSDTLLKNTSEFDMLKKLTFVTSVGPCPAIEQAGFNVIDVSLPERELVSSILRIHSISERASSSVQNQESSTTELLSQREKEVLVLMVKGYINKEIADKLNISTPTVIFHRNNICEKLSTRSIGKLTIYAVLAGIVNINEI